MTGRKLAKRGLDMDARLARARGSKSKDAEPSIGTETLNFKVSQQFKREFKGYAVSQGLSMVDLLKEGFELARQKRTRQ